MTALITFTQNPEQEDPRLEHLEFFSNFEDARERSDQLMLEFFDEYGKDCCERANEKKRFAWATNGEVVFRAYFKEIEDVALKQNSTAKKI